MSRKKKTDATDAQVEKLVAENEHGEGAGAGPAGSETGPTDAGAGTHAIDQAAPADGADDAGLADELEEVPPGGAEPEPDPDPADEPLDIDILAACAAAAMVFGTHEHDATSLPVQNYSFLSERPIRAAAQCAADFVRANRDTNAGVIPIHLGLKGHRPQKEPISHREHAAWTIFKAALDALDNMRKLEELDAEHARRAAEAKDKRPSAPRDRLALQPQDDALRPTGFTPSR